MKDIRSISMTPGIAQNQNVAIKEVLKLQVGKKNYMS